MIPWREERSGLVRLIFGEGREEYHERNAHNDGKPVPVPSRGGMEQKVPDDVSGDAEKGTVRNPPPTPKNPVISPIT
ncbi:MAG: hypothetical protein ACLFRY_15930 [Spirochaetia bacterium]